MQKHHHILSSNEYTFSSILQTTVWKSLHILDLFQYEYYIQHHLLQHTINKDLKEHRSYQTTFQEISIP